MKNTVILFFLACLLEENGGQRVIYLDVPVLLPLNDTCVRTAIQLGFKDIENEVVHNISKPPTVYKLRPSYYEVGKSILELITEMDKIHEFDALPEVFNKVAIAKLFAKYVFSSKRLTIGPPYSEQGVVFSEFTQAIPTIQVGYTEIIEPYHTSLNLHFQTPPSFFGLIRASKRFMEAMNWNQTILVYDFSSPRYRLTVNSMEEHLTDPNRSNRSINVVYKARIRSEVDDIRTNDLLKLSQFDARIVFLMASVAGARQTFCQAFHLELHKSNFVWILFEELPEGWATDEYNAFNEYTGKKEREVICNADELLFAAKSYIYITRGGARMDGKLTANNTYAEEFTSNLQNSVGQHVQCKDTPAYAYDSVWASARMYQKVFQEVAEFQKGFIYLFGFGFINIVAEAIERIDFEGVTGRISFRKEPLGKNPVRVGIISINVMHKGEKNARIGSYNNVTQTLQLVENATQLMFRGPIPSDRAHYIYTKYQFPRGYIFTIWILACLGILVTIILSCTIAVWRSKNQQILRKDSFWVDIVVSLGCIMCFASLIIYGLDTRFLALDNYINGCYGFLCTLSIGFTLTFGALFAKTWWKFKSYNAPNVQGDKREFSEWFMLIMICLFLLVDIVVLISWSVTSPFHYTTANLSNKTLTFGTEIEEIVKCEGAYQNQFLIALYCYKGFLLIFGVFLAWQTSSRTKGLSSFSSTKGDHMAIYNTVLVSIVGVICVSLLEDTGHRHALYAIVTLCVILCTVTILAMIYIPKISTILYPFGNDDSSHGSHDSQNNKPKFNKFTLEKLRRRVTKNGGKYPSVSSVTTSQISISTATSSLDSRRTVVPLSELNGDQRQGSFVTETSSHGGSFVSYNQTFSSPPSSTILEASSEAIPDIIATQPQLYSEDQNDSAPNEEEAIKTRQNDDVHENKYTKTDEGELVDE